MSNQPFPLELLPNELLIELFKYFPLRDLFQSFYDLNSRLNHLIHSLLHLTYTTDRGDHPVAAYPYVRTLIVDAKIPQQLISFPRIQRLKLDYVTDDFLAQFNGRTLPHLEYLSIDHKIHPCYMSALRAKIFSPCFPNLRYCYLSRMKPPSSAEVWTQSLSLRSLKLNDINASVFVSVLRACPNLISLKFKLPTRSTIDTDAMKHARLKRLIINMHYDDWPWDDSVLEGFLLCVPHLEQLRMLRSISNESTMVHYLQSYEWLSTMLRNHLPMLHRLQFDLRVHRSQELTEMDSQDVCNRWMNQFQRLHRSRYASRLVIS